MLFLCQRIAFAQQYTFQNYSVENDLSQSQVYAILEDSRGYLWLGTQGGGLDKFDGQNFINYSRPEGLKSVYINALTEDFESNIWIGTSDGLWKFDGWHFEKIELNRGKNVKILSLLTDNKGVIWVGTSKGFLSVKNGIVFPFSDEKKIRRAEIYALHQDSKGSIWVGSNFGIVKISGERIQQFSAKTGMPGETVTSFIEDENGRTWAGIYGHGVATIVGDNCYFLEPKSGKKPIQIQCLEAGKNGEIWVGTMNKGAFVWNPRDSIFSQFSERDGLAKNNVKSIKKDFWDNIWVGTSGGGISKSGGQQFVHFDTESGLVEDYVYAVCEDDFGRIWFSSYDRGVSIYNGRFFTHLIEENDSLRFISKAIFKDSEGNIWIGTEKKGMVLFKENQFRFLQQDFGFPIINVRDILEDNEGNIWVGTEGSGIIKIGNDSASLSGFSIDHLTTNTGLPSNRITNIHLDTLNRLWFSTRSVGIGYLTDNQLVEIFSASSGLVSREVKTMAEDSLGYLWFGTSFGISKMYLYGDSLIIDKDENNKKLRYKNLYLLAFDSENNLWTGSQKGVEKSIMDGGRNIIESKFFGRREGFFGIETCQNAVTKDQFGNLWFGTMNGLTKYQSGSEFFNQIPPKLHFTDIRLFYKPLKETNYSSYTQKWGVIEKGLTLQHKENHLNFKFLGVNLPNPEGVKYSWRLAGINSDWSPPDAQNEVQFPSLLPNKYAFMVKACNEDGIWTEEPLVAEFEILPPFWQTWWFRVVSGLTFLGLIALIFKFRLNQVRTKAKQEKAILELDKKLLQLEQKALQLQMNPHFIFNALNSIQSLISQKDHKTARYQLAKFSKLMRRILENSRDQAISIEQEIETLRQYLSLEKFSRGNSFDFNISTADDLEIEEIQIPPMIIQPFVENAIIHGVAHLENEGKIDIKFIPENEAIRCEVIDNGIGRKMAQQKKSQQDEQHKSLALEVTQERLEILGKSESPSLSIEDVLNNEGQINGTKVTIRLPIIS